MCCETVNLLWRNCARKGTFMNTAPDAFGIYLHIPYCHARCRYCDVLSTSGAHGVPQPYVDALLRELSRWKDRPPADTVYFGGGTPSLRRPAQAAALIAACNPRHGAESTRSEERRVGRQCR